MRRRHAALRRHHAVRLSASNFITGAGILAVMLSGGGGALMVLDGMHRLAVPRAQGALHAARRNCTLRHADITVDLWPARHASNFMDRELSAAAGEGDPDGVEAAAGREGGDDDGPLFFLRVRHNLSFEWGCSANHCQGGALRRHQVMLFREGELPNRSDYARQQLCLPTFAPLYAYAPDSGAGGNLSCWPSSAQLRSWLGELKQEVTVGGEKGANKTVRLPPQSVLVVRPRLLPPPFAAWYWMAGRLFETGEPDSWEPVGYRVGSVSNCYPYPRRAGAKVRVVDAVGATELRAELYRQITSGAMLLLCFALWLLGCRACGRNATEQGGELSATACELFADYSGSPPLSPRARAHLQADEQQRALLHSEQEHYGGTDGV
eukprot:TRINITY_DN56190_c0_g1_i1.p2 TRINITY_DN56190_c0_g1~~TRINITY_DN56190_c0_g1_i1.p2  ORF type:complete len:379 (+),score=116.01 TRINITY_DN56190_c0_g1_i1:76-1212(+)